MPLDDLIDRIKGDACREAERIVGEARTKGDSIVSAAEREADERYRKAVEAARHSAEEDKKQRVTMASLDARKGILEEKQRIIGEAFEKALRVISDLPQEQYVDLLVRQIVDVAADQGGELILSMRDRERVGMALIERANLELERAGKPGRLILSERTRDIAGGFILSAGGVEINNSLESQVNSRREELEARLVEILFEEN